MTITESIVVQGYLGAQLCVVMSHRTSSRTCTARLYFERLCSSGRGSQSSTTRPAVHFSHNRMYFVSGSFYEFARDGLFSFIINGFFGARTDNLRLGVQPQSLLELHLAQPPPNIVNLVNIGTWRRGRGAQG